MKPKIDIKDSSGNDYLISDIKSFYQHILDFHSSGISIHQENGHSFAVNDEFRDTIKNLYSQYNNRSK